MAAPGSVTSARTSAYQTAQEHDSSSPDPADPHSPIGYWTPAPSRLAQYEAGDEDEDEDDTPRAAAFQRALEEKAVEASGSSPVLLERYMDQDRTPAATPVLEVPLTRLQARLGASQASQTSSAVSTPRTSALKIKTRSASRHAQSPLPASSPLPPHLNAAYHPADPNPSSSLEQLENTTVEDTVIHIQEDNIDEAHTPDEPETQPENEDETEILAPGDYVDLPKPRVVIYVPTQSTPLSVPPRSSTVTDPVFDSPTAGIARMPHQADDEKRSDHSRTSSTISNPTDRLPVAGDESVIESFTSTTPREKDDANPSSAALTARPRLKEMLAPTQKTSKATEYMRKTIFDEKRSRDKHASQRRRRQLHKKRKRMFSCANGPVYSRALF
jgi:hypothetical protein